MATAVVQTAQLRPSQACSRSVANATCFRAPLRPQRVETRRAGPSVVCAATAVAERTAVANLGEDKWNTTYYPTGSDAAAVNKPWFVIDAEGQTLGRLANLAAFYIRGKNSVLYTPSMDMGAFIVVINADKVAVTGSKETDKLYHRHVVGRPGSWRTEALRDLRKRIPERIVEKAVKGMLPKGRIGSHLFTHLKVYKGPSHPHSAQQPVDITARIDKKPSDLV